MFHGGKTETTLNLCVRRPLINGDNYGDGENRRQLNDLRRGRVGGRVGKRKRRHTSSRCTEIEIVVDRGDYINIVQSFLFFFYLFIIY